MENSSFNVKPELFQNKKTESKENFINQVKEIRRENDSIRVLTNVYDFIITLYEGDIIRFTTSDKTFDLSKSFSLEDIALIKDFDFSIKLDHTIITYKSLKIMINHKPFLLVVYKNGVLKYKQNAISFFEGKTTLYFDRNRDDKIYGLGEKTGFLNKNNEKTVNWNSDVFEPHTRSNKELYVSINMFSYLASDNKFGLFIDNPGRVLFDFGSCENESQITCEVGKLDYYLYTGDSLKEIVLSHAFLTGKTYLPPLWALGYHQSRHSYESQDVLQDVYENFKKRDIPVDAIYLDIMYMDRYKVFTFNEETYKDINGIIRTLKDDGVHIVPIVDPGVKIEKNYSIYEEGLDENLYCMKDDEPFQGSVWPGECVFYDFMNEKARNAWGKNHQFYTDLGIDGIWNDMNEPAIFNQSKTMDFDVVHQFDGYQKTHQEVHNLYGLGMSMATYHGLKKLLDRRPFVLTRAGYAGIQKYATVWTGDNRSSWEHLEMTIPMCLNLSMSGVPLCGVDIGGFMDDCFEELFIRWMELGVFLPFFRNHSSINLKRQEPWQFGKRCEDISRTYIKLRYRLIRYLYNEVFNSHKTGIPIMRPLVFEYENDPLTYDIHDQFFFGSSIMVAPILRPGDTVRKVYLPEGTWFNFFTNEKYQGGRYILIHAEIDEIPVFVRENSVIPLTEPAFNTKHLSSEITLNVYAAGNAFKSHFVIDDGSTFAYLYGDYVQFSIAYDKKKLTVTPNKPNQYKIKVNIIE